MLIAISLDGQALADAEGGIQDEGLVDFHVASQLTSMLADGEAAHPTHRGDNAGLDTCNWWVGMKFRCADRLRIAHQ